MAVCSELVQSMPDMTPVDGAKAGGLLVACNIQSCVKVLGTIQHAWQWHADCMASYSKTNSL